MQPEFLVAYVTRSGSTGEVAEFVAETLSEAGAPAKAKQTVDVQSILDDAPVILGAALYAGHFPKEFHKFIVRFQRKLSNAPPWIFVLGPTDKEPKHFAAAEEEARKDLARYPWLHPADVRVLGGKFDPHNLKLAFPFSLVKMLPGNPFKKLPPSDVRDWDLIRNWARTIADHLNAAV